MNQQDAIEILDELSHLSMEPEFLYDDEMLERIYCSIIAVATQSGMTVMTQDEYDMKGDRDYV